MSWIKKIFRESSKAENPPPASVMALIDHEREAYRSVLLKLHAELRLMKREVFPEIQIKFGEENVPELYRLTRLDAFYKDGEKFGPAEANIKDPWIFAPMSENWGGLLVTAYPLAWNSIEFKVYGPLPAHEPIFAWHTKWYDAGDNRIADQDGLHNVVHNITAPEYFPDGWTVSVDFGSGPLEAFTEFFDLIKSMGATRLDIGSFSYAPASAAYVKR
jgi:hypothetical protein